MEDVGPIHLAAWFGLNGVIERLITKGRCHTPIVKQNGHRQNHSGHNTIHLAAINGHLETVKYLASFTDTPNQGNNLGVTPIHFAIKRGHLDIVKCLSGFTDTPNSSDIWGDTPIEYAAKYGHLDIVKFLVNFTDAPNAPNNGGY